MLCSESIVVGGNLHGSNNIVKPIATYAIKQSKGAVCLRPGGDTEWKRCAKAYFYSNFVLAFILLFSYTSDKNSGRADIDKVYGRYLEATKEGRKYTSKNSHYHYSFLHSL